ncbi:MAG TPA: LptF/LptG family permease [Tepidisphaeraceae bacterium]|jgi:lipopolysaccharide export LptBFGC system permease protein LptF|nr:LptF/LptG family permease [Tepidisphaeraceae bacterium]
MKIIDRYVLSMFIKNYLISFMVLIGMYVALDMVFNFANLTQTLPSTELTIGRIVYDISDFYFFNSFLFFVHMSGMIAVVAAAFTVVRLGRFNEMTALLAAGMPLYRIAMPVILAGVVLNVVLLPIDQEVIIPRMIPELMRSHGDVHEAALKMYPVHMMEDSRGDLLNAAMYSPPRPDSPAKIQYLDVIQRDANLQPLSHLYADQAVWNGPLKQWDLTNGFIVPIAAPKEQVVLAHARPQSVYRAAMTPDEIALNLGKDYIQLLPLQKINQLLGLKRYGTIDLLRAKNLRVTQWLLNVFMLLLAISTVLTREPGKLKSSAFNCLLLTGLCMGSVFVTYQMAASPPTPDWVDLWPALMAWMPIFLFGPLSIYLMSQIKT